MSLGIKNENLSKSIKCAVVSPSGMKNSGRLVPRAGQYISYHYFSGKTQWSKRRPPHADT